MKALGKFKTQLISTGHITYDSTYWSGNNSLHKKETSYVNTSVNSHHQYFT